MIIDMINDHSYICIVHKSEIIKKDVSCKIDVEHKEISCIEKFKINFHELSSYVKLIPESSFNDYVASDSKFLSDNIVMITFTHKDYLADEIITYYKNKSEALSLK
ncbi:MAG: hypothetical protein FWG91_05720 [Lachnospiraceae bacterium]|nr:hypothetical protein [Lachnospiraceae bacterium]